MSPGEPARHVVVMGLMGSGKSSVGRIVADRLAWPMHDSDREIEAAHGRTTRELAADAGVDAVHAIEAAHLLDALAAAGPDVICPAASTIDDEACRAALREPGVVVAWLRATPAVAAERFVRDAHRIWYGEDPADFLARQAAARYPHFRAAAAVAIDTDDLAPDEIAGRVLTALVELGAMPAGLRGDHQRD